MNYLPHRFQSITEWQWKAGQDRHRCATCRRDYGDLVHLVLLWPPVIRTSDYHDSLSAIDLFNGLRGLEDDAWAVTIKLWAIDAEMEVTTN